MAGDDRTDEIKIEQARAHVATIAYGMSLLLGPSGTAAVMLSGALGPLEVAYGKAQAIARMRELLDAYAEGEDAAPRSGHA